MNFAKYCIAPKNDFRVFVFVGGFSLLIASVFSLFGLIPSCDMVCPSHTFFGKNLSPFYRPYSLRFPVLLGLILIFVCVVPLFRVSQLLYRPAILVFGGRGFGLFSPGKWWVCRLVRKNPLGIGSIR